MDFSLREHTERSRAVWSTASFQLKLVNIDFYDDDDDGGDDDLYIIGAVCMYVCQQKSLFVYSKNFCVQIFF